MLRRRQDKRQRAKKAGSQELRLQQDHVPSRGGHLPPQQTTVGRSNLCAAVGFADTRAILFRRQQAARGISGHLVSLAGESYFRRGARGNLRKTFQWCGFFSTREGSFLHSNAWKRKAAGRN
jgi:hypothetical protein